MYRLHQLNLIVFVLSVIVMSTGWTITPINAWLDFLFGLDKQLNAWFAFLLGLDEQLFDDFTIIAGAWILSNFVSVFAYEKPVYH